MLSYVFFQVLLKEIQLTNGVDDSFVTLSRPIACSSHSVSRNGCLLPPHVSGLSAYMCRTQHTPPCVHCRDAVRCFYTSTPVIPHISFCRLLSPGRDVLRVSHMDTCRPVHILTFMMIQFHFIIFFDS